MKKTGGRAKFTPFPGRVIGGGGDRPDRPDREEYNEAWDRAKRKDLGSYIPAMSWDSRILDPVKPFFVGSCGVGILYPAFSPQCTCWPHRHTKTESHHGCDSRDSSHLRIALP